MGTRCYLSRDAALEVSRRHQLLSGRSAYEEKTVRARRVRVCGCTSYPRVRCARGIDVGDHSSFAGDDGLGRIPTTISRPAVVASLIFFASATRLRRAGRRRMPGSGRMRWKSVPVERGGGAGAPCLRPALRSEVAGTNKSAPRVAAGSRNASRYAPEKITAAPARAVRGRRRIRSGPAARVTRSGASCRARR
jgi:hypothetical protein